MGTRVLVLTQWFDPEPTFKGLEFARELVRQGLDVEVVTGFPNYPGGKLYPGYRMQWWKREQIDGVKVTRLPLYCSHDQSAVRRALNYGTFALSALIYLLFFADRPGVIYAYHPPLTVGVVAGLVRMFRRMPVVYDIQDMWPDTLRATGMISDARALATVNAVCNWVYQHVDHIVVLSAGFKRLLAERGVDEQRIDVIHNWCNESALNAPTEVALDEFVDTDKFNIVFAGNMGKAQALEAVLEAAAIVRQQAPAMRVVFLGSGIEVDNLKGIAAAMKLDNVVFLPAVPMEQVGAVLRAADVLLVHLRKDPLFEITIPSKTQAYMAVGRPILMAVKGDAATLVRRSGCGVVAESEDPQSIAAAALSLAEATECTRVAMAEAGRKFYQENLSLSVGVTQFRRIFLRLVARKAASGDC